MMTMFSTSIIIITISVGGAKGNQLYTGWLWNPDTAMFERTNIDGINNIIVFEMVVK